MALGHGASIVRNGLVFYVDAANSKSYSGSGNMWIDLSGNANNGTLTNGPTFSSSNGGYIVFDGNDDYIPFTTSVNAKTVLAFVRYTTDAGGDYVVYGLDANGADNFLGINANKISLFATETADVNNFTMFGNTTLQQNTWYQIGCTIDGPTAKIYLNGVQDNSTTRAYTIGSWNTAPVLGRRGSISQRYFPGNISTVQVYNSVLTSQQIQQNFNAIRGRYGI